MTEWFSNNAWWFLPGALLVFRTALELLTFRWTGADLDLHLRRTGQELCFTGLSFLGLALLVDSSKFYTEWEDIQGLAVFVLFIAFILLYLAAITAYKLSPSLRDVPFPKALAWLAVMIAPGALSLALASATF